MKTALISGVTGQDGAYLPRKKVYYKNELLKQLSKRMFWDVNIDTLDYKKNRDFIIERIVIYGKDKDEELLYKIYSWREVKRSVIKQVYLPDRIVRYLSFVFNIKEKKFKCYGKIPSHVNY